jgi:DNA-binding transcriptional MerR regulator
MSWSIAEVARMSGVTTRTLRHYDAIGLVRPAGTRAGGVRTYGEDELLRLQEVLVLRQLGLGLAEIREVVDQQRDAVPALKEHHARLVQEVARLTAVTATVARTIRELEGGRVSAEELFEGFDASAYEEEARERWPEQWEQAQARVQAQDPAQLQRETAEAMTRMAGLQAAGEPVDGKPVQDAVADWHAWISRIWVPDAEAFAALGRMYVEDDRFRATYERVAPGLAEYYRDAMAVYADRQLG